MAVLGLRSNALQTELHNVAISLCGRIPVPEMQWITDARDITHWLRPSNSNRPTWYSLKLSYCCSSFVWRLCGFCLFCLIFQQVTMFHSVQLHTHTHTHWLCTGVTAVFIVHVILIRLSAIISAQHEVFLHVVDSSRLSIVFPSVRPLPPSVRKMDVVRERSTWRRWCESRRGDGRRGIIYIACRWCIGLCSFALALSSTC